MATHFTIVSYAKQPAGNTNKFQPCQDHLAFLAIFLLGRSRSKSVVNAENQVIILSIFLPTQRQKKDELIFFPSVLNAIIAKTLWIKVPLL